MQYTDQITPGESNLLSLESETEEEIDDVCSNIEGVQTELPVGYEYDEDDTQSCVEEAQAVLESSRIDITELYPNAPSFDAGQNLSRSTTQMTLL